MSSPEEIEGEATVEKKEDVSESVGPGEVEKIEEQPVDSEKDSDLSEDQKVQKHPEDSEEIMESSDVLQESTSEDPEIEEQGDQPSAMLQEQTEVEKDCDEDEKVQDCDQPEISSPTDGEEEVDSVGEHDVSGAESPPPPPSPTPPPPPAEAAEVTPSPELLGTEDQPVESEIPAEVGEIVEQQREEEIENLKKGPTPPFDIETGDHRDEEPITAEQEQEEIEESEQGRESEPFLREGSAVTESITQLSESQLTEQEAEPDLVTAEEKSAMDSLVISHETEVFENQQRIADSEQQQDEMVESRETQRDEEETEQHNEAVVRNDGQLRSAEAGDFQSTSEAPKTVTPEPTVTETKEKAEPTAPAPKPASRLVRPPNRVIHTAPQGPTANRAQSATRPRICQLNHITQEQKKSLQLKLNNLLGRKCHPKDTAMPRPPAALVRSIKPPAPKMPLRPAAKEVVKKPAARTQSQPRPTIESKTVSQPTTPKVHRKIVTVTSKIGSFTDHKPQGGNVQIFSESRTYNAQSKIGSLHNVTHTPGGGNVKIPTVKLDFKEKAKPKIEAKSDYVPPVPEKKMITQKLNWNAQSKIGSLDNVKHKPAGGNVQILNQKLEWHATSKVGSKDNIKHKPGGGNVQIFDERIQYVSSTNHKSNGGSLSNVSNQSRHSHNAINMLDL
ncbi:unnamed protein product [Cylicocyclus nassatus]|uniref:Microtubule-associated protein n=1 Tax=Cylicocyclus nassatus TaxID=53992 RepID=A0AA36GV65_CYLNA|nr:unnamed protein product [Cylicocyclus nassatus]